MAQRPFGSLHTIDKLDCLERYLKAYLKVFKNRPGIRTVYVDAFAGTGDIPTASSYDELPLGIEDQEFIVESARRALALPECFTEYVFIEKKRGNARALEKLRAANPEKNIQIKNADANFGLRQLCEERDWRKCRAVVFLDPFGSQVDWVTLEELGKTKAIDLWYLFPAGLSVHRQLGDGVVHYTHEGSLTRILGTPEWRTAFIETMEEEPDLFGHEQSRQVKTATPESVTKFMHTRLESIFKGGVLNEWLPLGQNRAHWYSLMFAWANPDPKAKMAGQIALSVIRNGKRGRTK